MDSLEDKDLTSFWAHYNAVQAWIQIHNDARSAALQDYEWRRTEKEVDSLLNLDVSLDAHCSHIRYLSCRQT